MLRVDLLGQDAPRKLVMHNVSRNSSYTARDLDVLRRLVVFSRVNGDKYSWIRLVDIQSMSPSLDGDIELFIEWTQSYHYYEGDLIVISKPMLPFLIAHRACGCRTMAHGQEILQIADQFIFGDEISAGWVALRDVVGRVVRIRYGQKMRIATLESALIRRVASWAAKSSLRKLSHMEQHSNQLVVKFSVVQHRFSCYLFRIVSYVTAYFASKKLSN